MSTPRPDADPEKHRLHRDPDAVDGLKPEKMPDHRPADETDERSGESRKPYTTEVEGYVDPTVRRPDDPVQRSDATDPPTR